MFRIIGVTYVFTSNYGSCFQAYALQQTLNRMTVSSDTVDYKVLPISKCPGYPVSKEAGIKSKIKKQVRIITRRQFVAFEKNYMKYAPFYPVSDFERLNDIADAFVCGSDIVWNPKFNHDLKSYYLDFAKKYAFSYAASFGKSDIEESKLSEIGDLIGRLDAISVREKRSAQIAEQCTQKTDIRVVVDPVLLLNQDQWNQIAEKDNPFGKYIFVYSVSTTPLFQRFVEKLSRQTGLKVIRSGGNSGAVIKHRILKVQTPQRWLQQMRDAEYVVTDSFHGSVFSTIFRKNFFSIVDGDPKEGYNVRMNDFLNGIGQEGRIYSDIPETIDCSPIDYSETSEILRKQIEQSYDYIKENIEAAYQQKKAAEKTER